MVKARQMMIVKHGDADDPVNLRRSLAYGLTK